MKKVLSNTHVALSILVLGWMVLSYIEVLIKNPHPEPVYSSLNFLKVMLKVFG